MSPYTPWIFETLVSLARLPGGGFPSGEVYDLFGITFEGHPDLTRIPDATIGRHPLRKDYSVGSVPSVQRTPPVSEMADRGVCNLGVGTEEPTPSYREGAQGEGWKICVTGSAQQLGAVIHGPLTGDPRRKEEKATHNCKNLSAFVHYRSTWTPFLPDGVLRLPTGTGRGRCQAVPAVIGICTRDGEERRDTHLHAGSHQRDPHYY